MAFKDFLALADDKLHEVFARKPYDPTKARAAMLKRLDKAHDQFVATEPAKGRKMFVIKNSVVEMTLPFAIDGQSVFHIPSERFADAIEALKDSVNKGEADEHLKGDEGSTSEPQTAKVRKPRGALSPEALEARRAKMAEKGTLKNK